MSKINIKGIRHPFDNQEISWVGDCPWTGTIGFGTESGHYLAHPKYADEGYYENYQVSHDSVNGVAFSDDLATFTSRSMILTVRQITQGSINADPILGNDIGAHGVVSSVSGDFLLPLGPSGIMILSRDDKSPKISQRIFQLIGNPLNAYRMISIGAGPGGEVFVLASRTQGIFAFCHAGKFSISKAIGHSFAGHDIVDVCPVNLPGFPLGVLGLSLDRKVFFVPDILRQSKPDILGVLAYPELKGNGYGIYSKAGHLFMHTNHAFLSIPDAVSEFTNSNFPDSQRISSLRIEASDFFVCQDEQLFLLGNEFVLELPLLSLIGDTSAENENMNKPHEIETEVDDIPLIKSESSHVSEEYEFELQDA